MRTLGKITMVSLLVCVAGAAVVGVRSIPDVQRYLRIRSM